MELGGRVQFNGRVPEPHYPSPHSGTQVQWKHGVIGKARSYGVHRCRVVVATLLPLPFFVRSVDSMQRKTPPPSGSTASESSTRHCSKPTVSLFTWKALS